MIPRATYRLQFHRGFDFSAGAKLVPYLARLGISHVYSSPIQTARSGSTHGYDVVDHATINPELGGRDGFLEVANALKAHGMGIILDIVPNHMFVGDGSNAWWLDVLEFGRQSRFARHFDIDWDPPDPQLRGKVLLPFLDRPYEEALASGAIKFTFERSLGKLAFAHHGHRFPLRREDYPGILGGVPAKAADLAPFNRADALHGLLERQNYVLAWWQNAGDRINWRRFFDISDLAGLRVEHDTVFDAVHALPLELYAEGLVDGFRIDHIDGLADPAAYCRRLRARLAGLKKARPRKAAPGPAYIVVEKILARDEILPRDWGVDGTTGYDFLGEVSGLQHDPGGEPKLTALWQSLSGRSGVFEHEQRAARFEVLAAFEAQVTAAARAFSNAAMTLPEPDNLFEPVMRRALCNLIANLDCYRTYLTGGSAVASPPHLERAARRANSGAAPIDRGAIEFIVTLLSGRAAADPSMTADAARRFNQLASAIAAKGVEDTAFYRHAVLISRNDVGCDPGQFFPSPLAFHAACTRRRDLFPQAMVATATHDHKRGEDTRARLAVLSEIPSRWQTAVGEWLALTEPERSQSIEPSECYHLFQTLVGAWPLELTLANRSGLEQFRRRIQAWRIKSLREAKLKTSWIAIDAAYEAAHADFVNAILDPERSSPFLMSLQTFVEAIAPAGAANALAQTVLRLTTPGVADTYQGTEFWDFSLVDPDNRRDVDFSARQRSLGRGPNLSRLAKLWRDGRIKQALVARLLAHRASEPDLFAKGAYVPLEVRGEQARNVVAFARRHENRNIIVGVARCCAAAVVDRETIVPPPTWWADTHVFAPAVIGASVRDVLQPQRSLEGERSLLVSDLLSDLPSFVLAEDWP
jgi:(1->4)-alpha-D-glucan 1-alpha-D-glucosylmutase